MLDIKKIQIFNDQKILVTYMNNAKKTIDAQKLTQILDEKQNHVKKWSFVAGIEIVKFYPF
jgi:hypothetical protein